MSRCRKLRLNNKRVQQAVVDVDGSLELLQASGFELVFDESSPEPQASAAPIPTKDTPSQASTDERLSPAGQGTPAAADATEVSSSRVGIEHLFACRAGQQLLACPYISLCCAQIG